MIIHKDFQEKVTKAIQLGHQGETKCILQASATMFWPGISNQIKEMMKDCVTCQKF